MSSWLIASLNRPPVGCLFIIAPKVKAKIFLLVLLLGTWPTSSSSMMTMELEERGEPASLGRSWRVVKARTGFESATCLEISRVVLRGLVVVMMAPRDITARQTTGKKIELGEKRRITWPFRMPMSERDEATESTARQRSA